jgi:RNA polymerase sigma-70 factor (ECF subfamily)
VASVSDGNGAARISRRPVVGVERVAKYLAAITWYWEGVEVQWASTNGQTSALLRRDGAVEGVLTVTTSADGIDKVLWMMNPAKIRTMS